MQKFTRALTREIEIGGQRLAVTLSETGLSFRVVGSRRPPADVTWASCLCAATGETFAGAEPTPEEAEVALERLRSGAGKKAPGSAATASHPSGPADLTTLLPRLDSWYRGHRSRFYAGLKPAATTLQLENLRAVLPGPVPEELRKVLTWHNGQSHDVIGALESDWMLLCVEEIIKEKKELDATPPPGWTKDLIPLLEDNSRNLVVIDTSKPGMPLVSLWQGKPTHHEIAPSLTAWFEKLVSGVEKGEYYEDPDRGGFHRRS